MIETHRRAHHFHLLAAVFVAVAIGCGNPELRPAPKPALKSAPTMEPAKSINTTPDWPVHADDNQKLVKSMQDSGDKIEAERTVTYFCTFANLEDARAFSREASGKGFTIRERIDEGSVSVEITKVQDIRLVTVDKWSKWVFEMCEKRKGEYGGWSCDPVK